MVLPLAPTQFVPEHAGFPWDAACWAAIERHLRDRLLEARSERDAWRLVVRSSRQLMAAYTTSFFIVSRFLPRLKREMVEVIYASVRYPDEVVDTFDEANVVKEGRLDAWVAGYEAALKAPTLAEGVAAGASPWLAGFARVVREAGIPEEHYRAFLGAMRQDLQPRRYATIESLVDDYVYGSAIVVGFFLAHAYGPSAPDRMEEALQASRDLGIALQLTNFMRDIGEDLGRGRLYLPTAMLEAEGVAPEAVGRPVARAGVLRAARAVASIAEEHYQRSARAIDAFAPDCRVAIHACIEVYRRLNRRIIDSPDCVAVRQSVSPPEKWRALPPAKYWRLPLAMMERVLLR